MKSALLVSLVAPLAVIAEELKFKKTSISAPFIEQFTSDWDTRWKVSEAQKQTPEDYKAPEGESAEDLFRYRGEWAVEKAVKDGLEGDKGLVAKTPAAHHAISVAFPKSVDPDGKDFVVQYDLKLQEDLQCGGAYIKLLTDSKSGIKYHEFDDKTPYTIMFGPDRCGSTNKVHFIFRHLNPKTNKYEEKHLKSPPAIKTDQKTNLYTLVVHPDNTFEMYINLEKVKSGSLLEDFDPPVNPPKEIDDPEDKKPEDWVDEAKIPDPEAEKPDDWDEEAPRMIPDEDAVKPDDWLEDEPETVPDPNAEKPEDWDDDEDGDWVAPQVPNPKCESASGCGKWTRPMKPNPDYKGKWYAPLIDNPFYKGPWAPRKIANPDFYEDLHPAKFNKIMGLGIELWTMQSGIMFDNFYVGHSFEDAKKLAQETYTLKRKVEDATEEKEKKKAEEAEGTTGETTPKTVDELSKLLFDFFAAVAADPVEGFKKYPVTGSAALFAFASPILLYLFLFRSSGKKIDEVGKRKKEDISTPDDDEADDVKPKKKPVKKDE